MSNFVSPLLVLAIFASSKAQATTLEFGVQNGGSYKTQSLSGNGDFAEKKSDTEKSASNSNWNLSYARTTSELTNSSGGTIKDITNELNAGFTWEKPRNAESATSNSWDTGVNFTYSNSPEESLSSAGPQIFAGTTLYYGDTTSDFAPSFGFEFGLAQINYRQSFSTTTVRAGGRSGRPTTGDTQISQKSASLTLSWRPLDWFSTSLSGTGYSYDKDVAQFSQYLDSSPTLSSSSLGGLLSGFPASSGRWSLNFNLTENFDLGLITSRSTAAIGQTSSSSNKVMLGYHFLDSWIVSLGTQTSRTDATSTSAEVVDSLGLFSLSKDF